MNKLKYIFLMLLLGGIFSCKKDQLELYPYNQVETSQAFNTQADIDIAVNGMYSGLKNVYVSGIWNIVSDVLADNLIINQTGRLTLKTYGEWRYTGENTYNLFSQGYNIARRANAILENIDKSSAAESYKDNVKGQALAVRALIYFDMARTYSKTYLNASATDSTMPYVITTESTALPSKEPVKGFYDKVIADLENAKTKVGTTNGIFRVNKNSVSGLLSRVYLYKGDWAKTISSATEALGATPNVATRTEFPGIWKDSTNSGVLLKVNNTTLDNINSQGVNYYQTVSGQKKSEYVVPKSVRQLFTSTDIRTTAYLETSAFNGVSYNHVIKYNGRLSPGVAGVVDAKVLRTAEVLLNRAEAYFRSGDEPKAKTDLKLLKSNRYSSYDPTADDALSGQALLDEILLQRRLELAFEGDRFWDLKRRNLPVLRNSTEGEKADGTGTPYVFATLSAGDYRFQLPFPVEEINFNTNLKQNPGNY
jgi:starch-binding outer membrane protein, SusD/RagB family